MAVGNRCLFRTLRERQGYRPKRFGLQPVVRPRQVPVHTETPQFALFIRNREAEAAKGAHMVATLVSSRSITNTPKLESVGEFVSDDEKRKEMVRDIVDIVRQRARAAGDHMATASMDARASLTWPSNLLSSEHRLRKQIASTSASIFPLRLLQQRFALSETEQQLLWVLIADHLCPIARQLLRGLATEPTLDPTSDILLRVVFGEDRRLAMAELGPNGLLRRYGFIERVNVADAVPEHRISWMIVQRVIALANGDLGFDETLEHRPD